MDGEPDVPLPERDDHPRDLLEAAVASHEALVAMLQSMVVLVAAKDKEIGVLRAQLDITTKMRGLAGG